MPKAEQRCAKCGKKDREHSYWSDAPEEKSEHPHVIFKFSDKRSKKSSQKMLVFRLNSPGSSVLHYCKRYDGACVEHNYCYGLEKKKLGRSDFGWGECIHCISITIGRYDEGEDEWIIDDEARKIFETTIEELKSHDEAKRN